MSDARSPAALYLALSTTSDQVLLVVLAGLAVIALAAIGRSLWAARRLAQESEARRRALDETDQALALLTTLLENAPDGLGFIDRDLRFQRVNQALAALNGVGVEGHIGRTIHEVVPELAPTLEPLFRRVLETGEPVVDIELTGETPAHPGAPRSWLASYYPVRTPQGHTLGIGAIVVDISERKRAEEAQRFLAEVSTVLAGSLDYQTTLASVAQLAVPQIADWCAVDVLADGGRLERLAAVHADPELTPLVFDLHRRFPTDLASEHGVARVLRSGRPELHPQIEETLFNGDGEDAERRRLLGALGSRSAIVVPILARGRTLGAITLASGQSRRVYRRQELALAEKLSRRAAMAIENARLYREVQTALRDTRAAVAARDEFLSMASHELKTPLTALKGQVQLARRRLRRGAVDRVDELVEQADVQVDRLGMLVRDLLDVSRIAAGGFALERRPICVGMLVRRAVELERAAAPERQIDLAMPDDLPQIEADAARLEQVLINLLENAQKYSSPAAPVEVAVAADERAVAIAVRDRGIGIPPEERERIFERFQRASNIDQNVAGLGLGLHIAFEIVRAHGGTLSVDSTPGSGSTFTVTLPVSAAAQAGGAASDGGAATAVVPAAPTPVPATAHASGER